MSYEEQIMSEESRTVLRSNGGFCVYNRKSLKPSNNFRSARNPLKIREYHIFFGPSDSSCSVV